MRKKVSTSQNMIIGYKPKRMAVGTALRKYWQLYLLLLLPIVYFIIFRYKPMEFIIVAFKDYKLNMSVWEMPWASTKKEGIDIFKWFATAFKDQMFLKALKNTITLNIMDLVIGFPAPIIFALILNELTAKRYKKIVQTIAYMPHFLSWVIIYSIALQLLAPSSGLVNMILDNIGIGSIDFLGDPNTWVGTYIAFGVWQNFGWGSIVYLAAIAGINPELYEAASVDGAGRFKKMWHITLPGIKSTIVVLLIMALGGILGGNFDRNFAMQNKLNIAKSEVLSTFVYKRGIKSLKFELSTAVGLFQSVVGVFFLLSANFLSRKLGERGLW